jgi:hypothetical protein
MTTWTKIPGGGYHWQADDLNAYSVERVGSSWVLKAFQPDTMTRGWRAVITQNVPSLKAGKLKAREYQRVTQGKPVQ